jgi:predicted RNA-binding protein with RPS1 domain
MKQLTKDPWEEVAERYPVGKKVTGSVVRFADYGAFLRLEKDINGLVHLSELAHHKVADPSEVLTIGQKIDAQVINIDIDERRIGLSIKALKPIDKETLERLKREREEEEAKAATEKDAKKSGVEKAETDEGEAKAPKKKKKTATAEKSAGEASATEQTAAGGQAFVASKTGKKYYATDSTNGKKIKEENRIYFGSAEEAEKAGYSA